MKIVTRKTISRECYNLSGSLLKWLNEHLRVLKEDSIHIINWDAISYVYEGEEYTVGQVIDELIRITDELQKEEEFDYTASHEENHARLIKEAKRTERLKNRMYDLLKIVHWHLNW